MAKGQKYNVGDSVQVRIENTNGAIVINATVTNVNTPEAGSKGRTSYLVKPSEAGSRGSMTVGDSALFPAE